MTAFLTASADFIWSVAMLLFAIFALSMRKPIIRWIDHGGVKRLRPLIARIINRDLLK